MWTVEYCTDGASEPARTEVRTEDALRHWVAGVEVERKIAPRSIFDQEQYVNTPLRKQWGTGYWWLTVIGSGATGDE